MKGFSSLALLLSLLAFTRAEKTREEYEILFEDWRLEHGVDFRSGAEYVDALDKFIDNDKFIEAHNAKGERFSVGHNRFSHLSLEDFRSHYFGLEMPKLRYGVNEVFAPGEADVPEAIDWTTKGAVTPVKDQGQCGSCWAFSTTGSVEGAHAIATGELVSLSEQQLVDCDTFVNNGCNGGSMDFALMWVSRNGLCTEDSYAYTAKDGKCHPCKTAADIKKKYDVEQNNEEALLAAVAKQPVSIAIEADQRAFQLYAGGVFTAECGTKLNHGVLAVGYGEDEDGTKFWKVKNSWGEDWGEKGYIRMARDGRNNGAGQCGLAAQPVFPTA